MADAVISFDLADALGVGYNYRHTKMWVTFNTANGRVTDADGRVRVGAGNAVINPDGTGTISGVPIASGSTNPTAFQVKVHYDAPARNPAQRARDRDKGDFGWMTVTANADLQDLEEEQYAPPEYQGAFVTELEAIRDDAADSATAADGSADSAAASAATAHSIAGIDTTDAAMTFVAEDPDSDFHASQLASIDDRAITKAGSLLGGQRPSPLRVPTLTQEASWPNRDVDYRIVWTEDAGETLYGYGYDGSFYKSTNAGQTWTRKGYFGIPLNRQGCLVKTGAGTFVTFADGSAGPLYRSTDDMATWTVATGGTSSATTPLGVQSIAVDQNTDYIYWGEYSTDASKSVINLWRSTNDGATFTVFHAFPSGLAGGTDPDRIRHIHGVQWDPIDERIWVLTGDSEDAAGMYRVNSGGTDVEAVVINSDLPGITGDPARAIGVMFFEDYVAWIPDTAASYSYIQRFPRTDPTDVEVLTQYRLNGQGWFTCKASEDGDRWVACSGTDVGTSQIDHQIVHLYAVESEGTLIYDVGALPVTATTGEPAIGPIGQAEIHGDVFFMQAHNVDTTSTLAMTSPSQAFSRFGFWRFRLAEGAGIIGWPERRKNYYGRQTRNAGPVAVAGGFASTVVGHIRVPQNVTKLYVFDAGVDAQTGTRSDARISIGVRGAGGTIYDSTHRGESAFGTAEAGEIPVAIVSCTPADDLEIRMFSAGSAYTGTGYIDFAFGI